MYMNTNNSGKISDDSIMPNLPQKTLSFVYPEFQKHLKDIQSSKKSLSATPCFSAGSTRIKPIECDQSIKSLRSVMTSTEKMTTLIKSFDGQTILLFGSRNYNLLMKMYLAREKTTKLIETTKMLRAISSQDSPERTKICLRAHREFLSFHNELEKIEKEMELLLDNLMVGLTKNKNAQGVLVT